ncbi:MAG: TetR family transcriptional regulator [Ignavibacteria bacterium]|nr:TetR family transcriptional regulator [Ignavibacteria bacterium]
MPKEDTLEKEPKERILEAGALLFATKGYAAVGVREIAELAGVNVAMISYYFSGKAGILKEIILRYFDEVKGIYDKVLAQNIEPEIALKTIVKELVNLMKKKTIFCKVAITEMPFNLPEFMEFKAEVARRHIDYIKQGLQLIKLFVDDNRYNSIITPAAISLIFSHFLFGPFIQKVWNVELDENYYNLYSETISTLLLEGLTGLIKKLNNKGETK